MNQENLVPTPKGKGSRRVKQVGNPRKVATKPKKRDTRIGPKVPPVLARERIKELEKDMKKA